MAATYSQKLKTRLLLGVSIETVEPAFAAIDALPTDESTAIYTELDELLAAAEDVKVATTRIKAEGADIDPERDRAVIRQRVADLLGVGADPFGFLLI